MWKLKGKYKDFFRQKSRHTVPESVATAKKRSNRKVTIIHTYIKKSRKNLIKQPNFATLEIRKTKAYRTEQK